MSKTKINNTAKTKTFVISQNINGQWIDIVIDDVETKELGKLYEWLGRVGKKAEMVGRVFLERDNKIYGVMDLNHGPIRVRLG